jgi:hypothetical protein
MRWFFWIDADALFTNFDIEIESLIKEFATSSIFKPVDLLIAKDWNGLNSGVFLLRNSDDAKEYLKTVNAQERYFMSQYQEQDAMADVLRSQKLKWSEVEKRREEKRREEEKSLEKEQGPFSISPSHCFPSVPDTQTKIQLIPKRLATR